MRFRLFIFSCLFFFLAKPDFVANNAASASDLKLIRDAETEDFLSDISGSIFRAADLDCEDIRFYIVEDDSLNAFVFGGKNIFINTGLIKKFGDDPSVLMGVIAHETGHIASGHLGRSSEDMQNASRAMILTYLAGIAASIVKPDAGMAIIMGGSQTSERVFLKYTRNHEEAADRLALKYLKIADYPESGLLKLLKLFASEEAGYRNQIDEYALTHPVSKKRIDFIKANIDLKTEKIAEIKMAKSDFNQRLKRIAVKFEAFLGNPDLILKKYSAPDNLSSYARAIAYFKKGETKKSLNELNKVIAADYDDDYLWELKGQILFESGNVDEAIIAYKKAVDFGPKNDQARIALATAIISLNSFDEALNNFAISLLKQAAKKEKDDPNLFKQLSIAYNQNKDEGMAYLSLAEFNLILSDKDKAIKYAKLSKEKIDKKNAADLLRADDIILFANKIKDKESR